MSRLHLRRPAHDARGLHVVPREVPWEAADRFERFTVWLKPDWDAPDAPAAPDAPDADGD